MQDNRCEYCERPFSATPYPDIKLVDWESPSGYICIECAIQHLDGSQYKDPGECMAGATVPGDQDVRGSFLALTDAVFWAMVWTKRANEDQRDTPPNYDESATSRQLNAIHQALDRGDWEGGAALLAPIGAPPWSADRDQENPLYAWERENCRRTAAAWARLREWRAAQLPPDLQSLVRLPELSVPPG